jgi:uncharacterized damage-inducible protein DinB
MTTAAEARRLFDYNQRVFDRYLARLQRLPWATVTRDRGSGHLSMKDTMVHILNVHDGWLNYVVTGRVRALATAKGRTKAENPTWVDVRAYRDRVWAGEHALLDPLKDAQLRRVVKAPWMPGRYTLSDALQQVSFEQAHHLGEVIALLWQLDIEPPDMTWIDTLRGVPAPRAAPHRRRRASQRGGRA